MLTLEFSCESTIEIIHEINLFFYFLQIGTSAKNGDSATKFATIPMETIHALVWMVTKWTPLAKDAWLPILPMQNCILHTGTKYIVLPPTG